jgi:hypothetical protein
MRKILFAVSGAGTFLATATAIPAGALTLDLGAILPAIEVVNQVDKTWYRRYYGGYNRYRPYYHGYYGHRPYYRGHYGYRPYYGGYGYRGY